MAPLPSFTITGTLMDLLGPDATELSEVALSEARVTFVPNIPFDGFVDWEDTLYRVNPVRAMVDDDGGIITEDGDPVRLLANDNGLSVDDIQWQVRINIPAKVIPPSVAGQIKAWWFNALPDGETVDLSEVTPVPGTQVHPSTGGASGSAALRPIAAGYRPLRGIKPGVTSLLTTTVDITGIDYTLWSANSGKFRFVGCVPIAKPGDSGYCLNNNNGIAAGGGAQAIVIEFWSNATDIRVYYNTYGKQDAWATIDEQRITEGWEHFPDASGLAMWKITQSGATWRKYRICSGPEFNGIGINTGAKMVPTAPGFQLAVVGDSMVGWAIGIDNAVSPGVSGTIGAGNAFGEFMQFTGIDVWWCGIGASGYSVAGAGTAYGSAGRVAAVAAMPQMDAVLLWGSLNDGVNNAATIVAAAKAAWVAYKAAQPSAPLIVAGFEDIDITNTAFNDLNAALIAAAEGHPAVHAAIDLRAHPFITGTGKDGTPTGNGNADFMRASDGLHLTHLGARATGEGIARLLGTTVIPYRDGGSY